MSFVGENPNGCPGIFLLFSGSIIKQRIRDGTGREFESRAPQIFTRIFKKK